MNDTNLTNGLSASAQPLLQTFENSTLTHLVTPETLIVSAEYDNNSLIHESSSQIGSVSNESLSFILVPLVVILCVALTSGMAIYCIQRRRRLDNLRHTLIPLYQYNNRNQDDDEWGVLLDNYNSSGDSHRLSL